MADRKEASVATQWLLIAIGAISFIAIAAWSIFTGTWWLLAVVIVTTFVSGQGAWKSGLPLWPGRGPRVDGDDGEHPL